MGLELILSGHVGTDPLCNQKNQITSQKQRETGKKNDSRRPEVPKNFVNCYRPTGSDDCPSCIRPCVCHIKNSITLRYVQNARNAYLQLVRL